MRTIILFLVFLIVALPAAAAGPELYSDRDLAADEERYNRRVRQLVDTGLLAFMTQEETARLRGLVIRHPKRGAGPLTFKSGTLDGTPFLIVPLASLKFIEDLSVAYAWRYTHGHSLEPMDEYLAMLKHRPSAFPQEQAAAPLLVLGVPARIWERDKKVDDLSLRFRNTAWAFILAHELGHLRHGHTEGHGTPAEVQRQEEQADAFAVDLLSRSDTIPMGMVLWFQATVGYMKSRADFDSDAAYFAWVRAGAEHPVNGRRMRSLAALMSGQAARARNRNAADVLEFIAVRLAAMARIVEDPEMQQYIRRCASVRRGEDLKRLEDRACF